MDSTPDVPVIRERLGLGQELARDLELIKQLKAPELRGIRGAPRMEGWAVETQAEYALVGTAAGHLPLSDGPITPSALHFV